MTTSLHSLIAPLVALSRKAGEAIEAIGRDAFDTQRKADDSPVTAADLAAHQVIVRELPSIGCRDWPILSEESASIPWSERRNWSTYWLVDPLDGTKEFIRGSDQYTVNIALVDQNRPVLGVVEKPRTGEVWIGEPTRGAWYQADFDEPWQALQVRDSLPLRLVVSRFHRGASTRRLIESLPDVEVEELGSSLKCCRVAEGLADLYPRFGPTSEWDTAAAQAVVEGAGGHLVDCEAWKPLRYNTQDSLLNPAFVACASLDGAWRPFWAR
ncbi:3'(2'),5'-bisphosphate nucleotidase CysQ [Salinicola sp. MIT1003]|jgi:3'(2'), 5'-bisphosphate nucleotidase|uniref:3'(2'),5'-bisphosphate nucleotidase CysQ n=1 Tax=Salinicola sp. MIT1003 TaxID=1882734 RepID=UPI0008DCE08E|nr:3'(2'),5'-bisphosphate nucleotidase CysQ [Salinicola sp. MIT1003]OHZ04562.1 3'(2'),5'-bisphosphate nucleotidase [Salinicola sp. MIT1003]